MRRSIFKAGVWTALGLAIAFAVVSANSNTRHAATTAAKAAKATVATAASHDECTSSDLCCAKATKVEKAAVAVAPKKAVKHAAPANTMVPGSAGMVVAIDPETGQLGAPNAQQAAELQAHIMPADEGVATTTRMPDGSIRLNLNGTAVEYATVRIDANGKKSFGCTTDKPVPPAQTPTLEEK
jgi:hypothetical protein